jgi:K+-transporting ATPase ATPase A chain
MAQVFMFGRMVGRMRQGWAIWGAMFVLMVAGVAITYPAEQHGSQVLRDSGVNITAGSQQSGGNMQDKEVRFGIADTSLWASTTTNASNGSVNGGHDALTPIGGAVPLVNMFFGEVIWGGVGSGLYGMFFYVLIAVFVAGLMVGRTPEYLGKKIEAYEMKMASLVILIPCVIVLLGTAFAVVSPLGRATIFNPGVHGFSEALYAFSSAGNNNGSAFAGISANIPFYNTALGLVMLLGRFVPIVIVLALAGSFAQQQPVPVTKGTLPTHKALFVTMLVGVVLIVTGLTYFPALTLGPLAEGL